MSCSPHLNFWINSLSLIKFNVNAMLSLDTSVGIATGCSLNGRGIWLWFLAVTSFLLSCEQGTIFARGMKLTIISSEAKNNWSYTSIPTYTFTSWAICDGRLSWEPHTVGTTHKAQRLGLWNCDLATPRHHTKLLVLKVTKSGSSGHAAAPDYQSDPHSVSALDSCSGGSRFEFQ
jgi:hypothetical protein